MELYEITESMTKALDAHADESRASMKSQGDTMRNALGRVESNRKELQGFREESASSTATIRANLENMTALLGEVRDDVKSIDRKSTTHGVRLDVLESTIHDYGMATEPPHINLKSKYTAPILAVCLLLFTIGFFSLIGVNLSHQAEVLLHLTDDVVE